MSTHLKVESDQTVLHERLLANNLNRRRLLVHTIHVERLDVLTQLCEIVDAREHALEIR